MIKFTDKYLQHLQPREKVFDVRERDGFVLRVQPTGHKSFYFVYALQGKLRRICLGIYPAVTLSQARAKWHDLLQAKRRGEDPAAPVVVVPSRTVAEVIEEFIRRYTPTLRRPQEVTRYLQVEAVPWIGTIEADKLHRRDLVVIVHKIVDRGSPVSACNFLKAFRKCWSWAWENGLHDNLAATAGVKDPVPPVKKTRALSREEIQSFWACLDDPGHGTSLAVRNLLKFILVTGQRPGECNGLSYPEITDRLWTIPLSRDKEAKHRKGVPHAIPLTPLAIYLTSYRQEPFALDIRAVARALRRLLPRADDAQTGRIPPLNLPLFTPHDLRRTAATHWGSFGYSNEQIARVLGHSIGGTTAIYNRHAYEELVQEILSRWECELQALIAS